MSGSTWNKFWKKKPEAEKKDETKDDKKKESYILESDNLAIPEVHKKELEKCCCNNEECDPFFEDCQPAIPEVHLKKKKKDGE
ncbi:MAG: hypothetical protein KHZ87_08660 [Clostridiales bacterium]|nr:hypothetical protein [Clostridiales bacterium]MBS5878500.1 hypothetical protein [Clostridiales bacterium]MDU0940135.1 hypothetical protein [Clostridiales bacterium]MDU1042800.1 hypothetical protein [Clostridiales bacterium]MDU3490982.1 hypothetical protein [Clostridiales bacterium]